MISKTSPEPFAIVIGAGPSGLLLSLLLAQNGIPVTLIEKADALDKQPRATHYAGPAVKVLRRAHVLDAVIAKGFHPNKLTFRTFDNKVLAAIDHTGLPDETNRLVCLPLDQLGQILLDKLQKEPNATILWNHELVKIKDDNGIGVVTLETPEGERELHARYVVGCDGANSKLRRSLHGDWEFPGKTWETQVVATNVSVKPSSPCVMSSIAYQISQAYYDFHKFGYEDANFIIHPEHWYMASRITTDGMWRVSYGVPANLTRDELLAQRDEKWKEMLPGNPSPKDYRITNFSPYKVHQRLAKSMRVGPFILAADAAHCLGLTGGIVDVGGLADCLIALYEDRADDSILDIYSEMRSEKYRHFIDPVSSSNLVRMFDKDPETILQRDAMLQAINNVGNDPVKRGKLIDGIDVIEYDFSQHFRPQ